jgi:hypothetical protein
VNIDGGEVPHASLRPRGRRHRKNQTKAKKRDLEKLPASAARRKACPDYGSHS